MEPGLWMDTFYIRNKSWFVNTRPHDKSKYGKPFKPLHLTDR